MADELVDGPNASHITPEALDQWEARLEGIFEGRPADVIDAALCDTISRFPVDIQPFRDMVDGRGCHSSPSLLNLSRFGR